MTSKTKTQQPLVITEAEEFSATFALVGASGLYYNSMGLKAMRDLLAPGAKKTTADRAKTAKHYPLGEYAASITPYVGDDADVYLGFPASGVKGAIATAALDVGGVTKAATRRLVYINGETVPIYGMPKLRMDVVRSADMNRTPDVRTRAFLPSWATEVTVNFSTPLTTKSITALVASAGRLCGIGDFRQEKGAGNFGRWSIVPEWLVTEVKRPDGFYDRASGAIDERALVKAYEEAAAKGRAPSDGLTQEAVDLAVRWARLRYSTTRIAQQQAMREPECFDDLTRQLLEHWENEVSTRNLEVPQIFAGAA